MDIKFKTNRLMKKFNSEKELYRAFGKQTGQKIKRRMMVLMAAPSLGAISTLPPERMHELEGGRKGSFAVYLDHPFRLIFKPNHNPIPRKEDGSIDLNQVTAITILSVEDYH